MPVALIPPRSTALPGTTPASSWKPDRLDQAGIRAAAPLTSVRPRVGLRDLPCFTCSAAGGLRRQVTPTTSWSLIVFGAPLGSEFTACATAFDGRWIASSRTAASAAARTRLRSMAPTRTCCSLHETLARFHVAHEWPSCTSPLSPFPRSFMRVYAPSIGSALDSQRALFLDLMLERARPFTTLVRCSTRFHNCGTFYPGIFATSSCGASPGRTGHSITAHALNTIMPALDAYSATFLTPRMLSRAP